MMLGIQIGMHGMGGRATIPALLGAVARTDGVDPVPTTHSAGNLLVNGSANNNTHSSVAPSLGGSWALADPSHSVLGGTNRAAAFWQQIAAGAGTTGTWSNTNIPRVVWAFANAAFDKGVTFDVASSTTLTWPSLTALSMAPNCIVCAVIMCRTAQTSMATSVGTPMAALGFTQRAVRNTAPALWVGDTGTNLLSSFAPAAQTLDTLSSQTGFVFCVKVAP